MNFWQSFRIALEMLRLHKLRAFLTMLGVIIGVMSVTIIVMVSSGFQYFMTNQFQKLGSDSIYLAYSPGRLDRGTRVGNIAGLRLADVTYIKDRVQEVDLAAPILQVPTQKVIREDHELSDPRIFASDEYYGKLNRLDLASGRYIDENDVRDRANVCMIGEEVDKKLFPEGNPLGKYLTFKGITLQVIGVLQRIDLMGGTNAKDILLPITTAQDKWLGTEDLMMITLRPKSGYTVDATMDAVWRAMMVKSENKPIYRLDSQESIVGVFNTIFGVAGTVLAGIAALSLLVGGIGIMNIMLVSVTERTREIGLRKAVGARNGAILTQFLVESAMLSVVGGLIGMSIAYVLGMGVTALTATMNWPSAGGLPTPFPITAAVMATIFSAMIGVVFGLYPAFSAAKLDPIDALRRE